MKELHNNKPNAILSLGNGKYRLYYNSVEIINEDYTSWESEYIDVDSIEYSNIVDSLIKRKYSSSNELAIIRQRDTKNVEYQQYYEYCEACKLMAKEFNTGTI